LTQIHFQDLSPVAGGVRVNLTSQAFDIPVCGQGGASGSTITTYLPINLCVSQGDYVAFNDEGGYVPYVYRSGVPYQVIGSSPGSTLDSFIKGNGTNNGSTLSSSDTTANDGFSQSRDEELMLGVTLGTGPDATHICPGGTGGEAPALSPIHVRPQTDGVNHSGVVAVAVYCRPSSGCRGAATLTLAGGHTTFSRASFNLMGNKTGRMQMRLSSKLLAMIRKRHGVTAIVTASMGATTVTQAITIKIL
jgi:hypothetical protein